MPIKSAPERVTVTIPEDVRDLFVWIKNYDLQFEGRDASIGAYLLKLGAEAYYQKGLEKIEPLDPIMTEALHASGIKGLSDVVNEQIDSAIPHARAR